MNKERPFENQDASYTFLACPCLAKFSSMDDFLVQAMLTGEVFSYVARRIDFD